MDREEYLKRVKSYIKTPTKDLEKQLDEFCNFCTYVSGQYDQDDSFIQLEKHMQEIEKGRKETNRVFYMALPPSVFITVSQHLKRNCYPKSGIARVIVSYMRTPNLCSDDSLQWHRSRSHLARISRVHGSCKRHSLQTGLKTSSTALTTIWVRRWSRTSSFSDSATSSLAQPGTGTTSTTFRYGKLEWPADGDADEHRSPSRSHLELRDEEVTLTSSASSVMSCKTVSGST